MKKHIIAAAAALALLASTAPGAYAQTLNIGMAAADVGQLDPHRATTTQDKPVVSWIFNGLVRFKPGSASLETLEPDLAEKWESSPDKLTWTFTLRKGVKFHGDYGEMTSEDVVYSLKRAADSKTSSFAADYGAIDSIEAVDPSTVRIKLKQAIPSLLGLVTNYHGGNIVSKKAVEALGADFRLKPIGTGPFAFQEYKPNESLTLVANKSYFRGAPKLEKIVYRFIPADSARDLAFTSGELDLVYGRQDQKWAERFKKEKDVVVDVLRPAELSVIHLNMAMKPLDDKRVRQAVAYAINRAQMVQFKGELVAEEPTSVVPNGYLGTVKAPLFPHDVAKAKALLKEAGFENGVQLKSVQTSLPTMLNSMQIVQNQLKQAGIDLQLEVVDHQTYHANIRKDLSGVSYYSAARFPVADVYLTQFYSSKSIVGTPTAVTNFSHCTVADKEIDAARSEPDLAKQKELWAEAQKKIVEEVCSVPLFEQLQVWAHKTNVNFGYELKDAIHLGPVITEATTKK
ncbi:ABC transporter substrate-binding protein [Alsobacter metallidurans]|uniref:ABC transporter substrate-binding protein n=1 Tax=Alsobacter metallidurans TaxID=340221 RepID=A0A917I6Q1_9HYPH|nr:ABC transporter substrate-binding protein [Alsobacter metallidurans]GGH16505.1 ABC transporter substrate-binding protein [Alsobacter metallidurans]